MKHRNLMIWLLTAVLLAMAALAGYLVWSAHVTLPFSLQVLTDGAEETIRPWKHSGRNFNFFLPGYSELSDAEIVMSDFGRLTMNGVPVKDGTDCEDFPLETPMEVVWRVFGKEYHFNVTFYRSGSVPTLFLDVKSGSMDYIHQERNNKESGTLRLYDVEGALIQNVDMTYLETRGNSTILSDKKPYNLQLTRDEDLLGMGAARRWVLLANHYDDSYLRNKIVFDFARDLGLTVSPESRWVDLYLNGDYAGLYLLSERVEIHPQRIDIAGEGIFLVNKDWEWRIAEKQQHYVKTESDMALRVFESDLEDSELIAVLQSVENAILAEDGIDPVTGKHYGELIDVDTWVRKYLIEEVFANVDGMTLSQFFYRDGTGKVYAGPVWDYDLAIGHDRAYPAPAPNMFYANREGIHGSAWYPALYQNPEFYSRMVEIYQNEFLPALDVLLTETIPEYAMSISDAAAMDVARWTNKWVPRDPQGETARILEYMKERVAFLNDIWIQESPYHTVMVDIGDGVVMRYEVRHGEPLPPLPAWEDTEKKVYLGWALEETGGFFDQEAPILEDTALYLVTETPEQIPEEIPEPPETPLRYVPIVLLVGFLAGAMLWDGLRHCRKPRAKKKETVSV